jgi:hypothetical protein
MFITRSDLPSLRRSHGGHEFGHLGVLLLQGFSQVDDVAAKVLDLKFQLFVVLEKEAIKMINIKIRSQLFVDSFRK